MSSDVQNNLHRIVRDLGVDDIVAILSERYQEPILIRCCLRYLERKPIGRHQVTY